MSRKSYRAPLTAAALTILLAACGGGEGGAGASQHGLDSTQTVKEASTDGQPANGKPTNTGTEAAGGVPPVTPESVVTAPDAVPTAQPMTAPTAMPTVGNSTANDAAQAPAGPQVDPGIRVPYTAPIGSQGVSGQVLVTMLDQKACDRPVPHAALDGEPIPNDQVDVSTISADARIKPENYAKVPNPPYPQPSSRMFDATCSPTFYTYQSMGIGEHELTVYSTPLRYAPPLPQEKRSLNGLITKVPIQVGLQDITLAKDIQVSNYFDTGSPPLQITPPEGPTGEQLTLTRDSGFSFQRKSHISYGVLAEWKQGDKVSRLMLLPGKTEGEARLCWNHELSFVRRLQCKVWTAPEDWRYGQSLKYEGQYLVDDRSTYPGEEGMRFWKTRPLPETAPAAAQ